MTRTWLDAPSVGDLDRDGSADAEDGYKSEPERWRHDGDRKAPLGVPVSWAGGSGDHGHRALSLGVPKGASECLIRSTDAGGPGHVATVPLSWVEKNWGLRYVGWSESMSGILIPRENDDDAADPLEPTRVTEMHRLLKKSLRLGDEVLVIANKANNMRRVRRIRTAQSLINSAIKELPTR